MKYQLTFKLVDGEEAAKKFCEKMDALSTYYMRKHHPAHYTPWNHPQYPNTYICWYMW